MPTDFAGMDGGGSGGTRGVAFLVSAGIVFEIIAFACSSPQTAEINIGKRAGTLMKWVHLGEGLGAAFVILAMCLDKSGNEGPILFGGTVAIISSEAFYRHAKKSGLAKPGATTEQDYA